jgi:diacylglycerol kinase (ATP)
MRALLICSPSAGNDGPSQDDLLSIFRQEGIDPSCCLITEGNLSDALQTPTDVIVAVGGDGTVTSILTEMPGRGIPVAVVPQGTANNIAHSLGIYASPHQIAAGLRHARPMAVDIGVATGSWGKRRFVEGVGLGLLVQAMAEIDAAGIAGDDQLWSCRAEFGAKLVEEECHRFDVSVDGRDLSGDFLIFEIMNIGYVGPVLPLAPQADPGDGWLDVVYSTANRRGEMLQWLSAGPEGLDPPVETARGRKIEIAEAGAALRLGDNFSPAPGNAGRLVIELEPEQATILVPSTISSTRGGTSGNPLF